MADYQSLLNTINGTITDNNHGDIDGPALNSVLRAMVGDLGKGYQYMGVASPGGTPASTDAPIFYIAGPGTYPNFGGLSVGDDEVAVLKKDSNGWTKEVTGAASAAEVSQLDQYVN